MKIEIKPLAPPQLLEVSASEPSESIAGAANENCADQPAIPLPPTRAVNDAVQAQSRMEPPEGGHLHPAGVEGRIPTRAGGSTVGRCWRKVGGGSLGISLLIHLGILVGAYFMVQTVVQKESPVDFLPGGGSKAGQEASASLNAQLQQKKQSNLMKSTPMKRVVSTAASTAIALPDLPLESTDMPEMSSPLGGGLSSGSFGGGGFGTGGAGEGFGNGIGMGGRKGFAPMTVFGRAGEGEGLPGGFYDMKQDRGRKPLSRPGGIKEYAAIINKAADAGFTETSLNGYYRAKQEMSFTYLMVPTSTLAATGPKCFQAEKEVEPSCWFVHYSGQVTAPNSGPWRFVGFFDDVLVVYVNNKPVLDGSWGTIVSGGDQEIRQALPGPTVAADRKAVAGKWVRMAEPFKLDIVVGERPGGKVGGVLMVQNQTEKYELREDGSPILPIFTTAKLDLSDNKRLQNDEFAKRLQLARNPPVFEVRSSALGAGRPRGLGLLPPLR